MKFAVSDHFRDFSAGVFADAFDQGTQVYCSKSGEVLYDTETSFQVEHVAPETLQVLVNTWLAQEGITLEQVRLETLETPCSPCARIGGSVVFIICCV